MNDEATSMWLPRHNVLEIVLLHVAQHIVESYREVFVLLLQVTLINICVVSIDFTASSGCNV
jgi:hypothetical protein